MQCLPLVRCEEAEQCAAVSPSRLALEGTAAVRGDVVEADLLPLQQRGVAAVVRQRCTGPCPDGFHSFKPRQVRAARHERAGRVGLWWREES